MNGYELVVPLAAKEAFVKILQCGGIEGLEGDMGLCDLRSAGFTARYIDPQRKSDLLKIGARIYNGDGTPAERLKASVYRSETAAPRKLPE